MANAMNPNKLFPHLNLNVSTIFFERFHDVFDVKKGITYPSPSAEYIYGPANGKNAANKHRIHVNPAIALAAYCPAASIKYVWIPA